MLEKNQKPIELRKILNSEDPSYEIVLKIKEFLGTESKSIILDFILVRISKIPFSDFVNLNSNEEIKVIS